MSTRFNSRQARYSPPHITLHMPFEWKDDKEDRLQHEFGKAVRGIADFKIRLNGFGAFPPRVIFIKPEPNAELTNLFEKVGEAARLKLNLLNQDRNARPFHPHLTIAFRDLRRDAFTSAWSEFKDRKLEVSFDCSSIWILKKSDKYWIQHKELPFS